MLVVTTTMRMVNGIHSNTTSTGPVVTLGLVFVESTTGLQQGLVNSASSSNDTDGGSGFTRDGLLGTRWETNAGLVLIG